MSNTHKEMMTVDQFLEIYSITRSQYFTEVRNARLKITREGRRTYIKRTNAEAWLAAFGKED